MIDLTKISNKKGIYEFYHPSDGKRYFGKTINNLQIRISDHKTDKTKDYFHNAIRCHGWDSFEVNVLHEFDEITEEELLWIEANYIECYETYKEENGYNILRYGSCRIGYKHSKKTCEKMSKSQKLKYENGYIHPMTGKNHTLEACEKISKGNTGKILSNETKQKVSKNNGRGMLGKHHTPETIKFLSERIVTEESKQKIKEKRLKQDMSFCKKKIKQINLQTDEIIKVWDSIEEATLFLTGKEQGGHISSVCRGKRNHTLGFKWEYVNEHII